MSVYKSSSSRGVDSQITLVDRSIHKAPHTVLSFDRNDMKNTRIFSDDEQLLYTVDTDSKTSTHTIVRRGDIDEIVAEVKRKEFRPDTVKFGKEEERKLSSWLCGSSGKWSDFPASFTWNGVKYIWKANDARQIALYEESDHSNPIAWFQTPRKMIVNGVPTTFRALLALQPDGLKILDAVVVSLLVVEYSLRMKECRYHNSDGRLAL